MVAVAASAALCTFAQDMGEDVEEQTQAPETEESSPEPEEPVAPEIETKVTPADSDPGPAIVVEAQQWSAEPVQDAEQKPEKLNASEKVQLQLEKNNKFEGFVPGSRAIIQIGTASDLVKDINKSETFMKLREGLAREAVLNARASIAKRLRQKMAAGEIIIESDSQEFDKYKAKHAEEYAELERQKIKVANLLKKVDAAEAATLEGRTIEDDWDAIVSGIIKKIDESYDPSKVAAEKKARYAEMKEAYEAAKKQLDALKAAYESDPIGKNISDVKACFDLDMYGVHVLYQAESYDEDDGVYEVACAAVWSPKLQQRAILSLNGKKNEKSKPGKLSLAEWLRGKAVENDKGVSAIASMVGPRQYTDDKGHQHILGFAACTMPKNPRNRQREKEKTNLEAEKIVLSSLYQETSGTQEKHDELLMYAGNEDAQRETDALGTYAKKLIGKTPERPVSGIGKVFSKETVHPLTGKKIYVCVASVDSELAFEAESLLDEISGAAVQDAVRKQYTEGKEAARKDIVDRARNTQDAYRKGKKDAADSLHAILSESAGIGDNSVAPTPVKKQTSGAGPKPTVVSGDDDEISDDF